MSIAPDESGGSDEDAVRGARETFPNGAGRRATHWLKKLLLWACPVLCLALLTGVLVLLGLSWLSAVAIVAGTSCLAILAWGAREVLKRPAVDPGAACHTKGRTIEWLAPFYDRLCAAIGLDERFRRKTVDLAAPMAGDAVLDVGCGTGVLTRLPAKAVGPSGRCVGIDPGPRMIAIARRNAAREGSAARFELAAIEAMPFADASVDVVFMSFMLHHLPPEIREIGLREVMRVLRPGGRLVAVDVELPASGAWRHVFRLMRAVTGASMFSSSEPLAGALQGAGFEAARVMRLRPPIVTLVLARKARQAVGPSEAGSPAAQFGERPR